MDWRLCNVVMTVMSCLVFIFFWCSFERCEAKFVVKN